MASRRPGNRGFTLLEIAVVLSVIGIVVAMAVPSFSRYIASTRLVGARNMLMGDMRFARALANSQRRTHMLRRTTSGYTLVSLNPTTLVLSREMPQQVTFSAVDSTAFFAWGLTQPAAITMQMGSRTAVVRMTAAGQVTHD